MVKRFVFESYFFDAIECLSPETQNEMINAILKFAFRDEEYKSDIPSLNGMFKLIKNQIEKEDLSEESGVNNHVIHVNKSLISNFEGLDTELHDNSQLEADFSEDPTKRERSKEKNYIPSDSNLDNNNNNINKPSSLRSDGMSKSGDFDPPITPNDEINFCLLTSFWNETLEKAKSIIPKLRKIDEERRKSVLARVREYSKEDLMEMIQKVAVNDFLNGKNDRGWVATFDWCIKPRNFKKIIEDNYNNTNIQNGSSKQEREYDRRRGVPAGDRPVEEFYSGF